MCAAFGSSFLLLNTRHVVQLRAKCVLLAFFDPPANKESIILIVPLRLEVVATILESFYVETDF